MCNQLDNLMLLDNHTVSEYFAGIGLVRLGLEQAGWKVIFANDFDDKKYEMYSAYFQDSEEHHVRDDIFALDPSTVPETFLATSSFPCIDLSLAGNQGGLNGVHSSAFWGFIRILREQGEKRPPLVLLENVPGWLTSNKGQDFRLTTQALNELGYNCDVYSIDAIRFTPQSRLRIFMVGLRTDEPHNNIGKLLQRPSSLANKALKKVARANPDLKWHILSVPAPPEKNVQGLFSIVENMLDDDPRWWSQNQVNRHLDMMADSHLARVNSLSEKDSVSYRTIYRRIRYEMQRAEVRKGDTAGCLRTARGGSSRQIIVQAGEGKIRMRHMTPREYARLQGAPDDYPIPENVIQALTGFGDAVCVPVITWIAKNILNPIAMDVEPDWTQEELVFPIQLALKEFLSV